MNIALSSNQLKKVRTMKNEENIIIYAIIPKYIYKTKELTSEEKLIAERITYLCKKKGFAWVSNKTLADMYGIKEDTVSKHIKKLKEVGFIYCSYNKDQNNHSKRIIYLSNNIWDKQPTNNSIYIPKELGYLSRHNNKINYKNNNLNNIISYDFDGTMLWNGKRCESALCTEEAQKELEELLSCYKDDSCE